MDQPGEIAMLQICSAIYRVALLGIISAAALPATSVTLSNLQIVPAPFGRVGDKIAINDQGDIAGTSLTGGIGAVGFLTPANTGIPALISQTNAAYTDVNGINDTGVAVGYYFVSPGSLLGFTYSGGAYAPVNAGLFTFAEGINNLGDVTGYESAVGSTATGFLIKNGAETTFSVPGHLLDTLAEAINDSDQIVGYYNHVTQGFLRQANGSLQLLDFPAFGINNSGIIVGSQSTGYNTGVGILYLNGADFTYAFPGAISTGFYGINNNNEVIGTYVDSNSNTHIFEGQLTPEPSTAGICGLCFIASALLSRYRRSRSNHCV